MSNTPDGGPFNDYLNSAFGVPAKYPEMSLRDYFAAKAMNALIREDTDKMMPWSIQATYAYQIADAMLRERAK